MNEMSLFCVNSKRISKLNNKEKLVKVTVKETHHYIFSFFVIHAILIVATVAM